MQDSFLNVAFRNPGLKNSMETLNGEAFPKPMWKLLKMNKQALFATGLFDGFESGFKRISDRCQ
jgi:hypothetical protein